MLDRIFDLGRINEKINNFKPELKRVYFNYLINESQKLSYYSIIEEINKNTDYQNKPFEIGDITIFNETIQQLSIMTFKNMQRYYEKNSLKNKHCLFFSTII